MMLNTNNPNPLLNTIFSKESLTFIQAERIWQIRQWQALTRSPFSATFIPHDQPSLPNPEVSQPRLFDDTPQRED
jgi:hypothetical protein